MLAGGRPVTKGDLNEEMTAVPKAKALAQEGTPTSTEGLAATLQDMERRIILTTLEREQGNISRSARALNLSRDNLRKRMRKLKLQNPFS